MVERQIEKAKCMIGGVGENADKQIVESVLNVGPRKFKFASGSLYGNFGNGNGADFRNVLRICQHPECSFSEAPRFPGSENQNGCVDEKPHLLALIEHGIHFLV